MSRRSASRPPRRTAIFLVGLLVALPIANVVYADEPQPRSGKIDEAEDCLEAVPDQASIAGVTDTGQEVELDVLLLLDGVSRSRGAEVMRQMQAAYTPLKIRVAPSFREVDIPPQRMEPSGISGGDPVPTSDVNYLFKHAKEAVGGVRPKGIDVVYLLTSDEITGTTAGVADCIGGVRYPNRAFAIGEEEPDRAPSATLNFCCTWATAKIAGHELAHLLGAHHHYANCGEGAPTAVADRHLLTCTMMFNDIGGVNLHFSALEGAVVRGHAVKYASDDDVDPDPIPGSPVTHSRTLGLSLRRHLIARGKVDAGEAEICSGGVNVRIERKKNGAWKRVATASTGANGSYRTPISDRPGRYRAVLAQTSDRSGPIEQRCSAASSRPVRHAHP